MENGSTQWILGAAGRLQIAFVALPLLFLGLAAVNTARAHFRPSADNYQEPVKVPSWNDPDLRAFADAVAERVPEGDGILIEITEFRSTRPRARWFLALNYFLAPRRLYLDRADDASGTIRHFYRWLNAYDGTRRANRESQSKFEQFLREEQVGWIIRLKLGDDFEWDGERPDDGQLLNLRSSRIVPLQRPTEDRP